jgi:voltage-gated sodium channel
MELSICFFEAAMFSGILVGIQTNKAMQGNAAIFAIETVILLIFITEAVLKIMAEAPKPWRYFRDSWNIMDFVIATAGFADFVMGLAGVAMEGGAAGALMVFRLFRLMRIMKLVKSIPQLRIIVSTMITAMPSVMYISILIFLLLYIYGVLGCFIFGDNDPKYFGDLGTSLVTLFRVMTMDHWGEIMYIELYGCEDQYTPNDKMKYGCDKSSGSGFFTVVFFLTFIMIVSFIVLNLFIGVVTSSLNQATREVKSDPETEGNVDEYEEPTNTQIETLVLSLQEELQDCRQEMGDIRDKLAMILQEQQ